MTHPEPTFLNTHILSANRQCSVKNSPMLGMTNTCLANNLETKIQQLVKNQRILTYIFGVYGWITPNLAGPSPNLTAEKLAH